MKTLALTKGKEAIVDDCDFDLVSSFKWFACENKSLFYAVRTKVYPRINGKQPSERIFMHKVILGLAKTELVVWKDHNPLNMQRGNMVVTNMAGQSHNNRGRNNGMPKGVRKHFNRFEARIKSQPIGYFDSAEQAEQAVINKQQQFISINTLKK